MRRAALIFTAALICAATGCVQQDRYDNAVMSSRSLKEQLVAAQQERDVANANIQTVREQLTQARAENDALQAQINDLNLAMDVQVQKYDDMLRRVSQLEFSPLPAELEEALDHLAAAYPDLLTFDADRGLLRFSSDFSFDSGSAELTPEAAATLATLADILVAEPADAFELRLVGHTDNVPVERPATLRKHPTNVHLSVHRAIAVRAELVAAGVEPERIQVAGYGEFRPIVPNGPKGARENRRVELLLVPARSTSAARMPEANVPTAVPAEMDVPQK